MNILNDEQLKGGLVIVLLKLYKYKMNCMKLYAREDSSA